MTTAKIKVADIELNDDRVEGGMGDTGSLARNMERYGQINPVTVVDAGGRPCRYRIVTGRRRVTAARLLGWTEIMANVYARGEIADEDMYALSENAAREDMDALDEGVLYAKELRRGTPVEELAALFCRSKSAVYQRARLSRLVPEMRVLYKEGRMPLHVAAMAADLPEDAQVFIAKRPERHVDEWDIRTTVQRVSGDTLGRFPAPEKCATCQKRTRYSDKSLFPELAGGIDRCFDHACYCRAWKSFIQKQYDDFLSMGCNDGARTDGLRVIATAAVPEGLSLYGTDVKGLDSGEVVISGKDRKLLERLSGRVRNAVLYDGAGFCVVPVADRADVTAAREDIAAAKRTAAPKQEREQEAAADVGARFRSGVKRAVLEANLVPEIKERAWLATIAAVRGRWDVIAGYLGNDPRDGRDSARDKYNVLVKYPAGKLLEALMYSALCEWEMESPLYGAGKIGEDAAGWYAELGADVDALLDQAKEAGAGMD